MDHQVLVFYMEKNILEDLDPYQTGGEMIDFVSIEKSTYTGLPHKFEAGTPNIVGAISLGHAIDFVKTLECRKLKSSVKLLRIIY